MSYPLPEAGDERFHHLPSAAFAFHGYILGHQGPWQHCRDCHDRILTVFPDLARHLNRKEVGAQWVRRWNRESIENLRAPKLLADLCAFWAIRSARYDLGLEAGSREVGPHDARVVMNAIGGFLTRPDGSPATLGDQGRFNHNVSHLAHIQVTEAKEEDDVERETPAGLTPFPPEYGPESEHDESLRDGLFDDPEEVHLEDDDPGDDDVREDYRSTGVATTPGDYEELCPYCLQLAEVLTSGYLGRKPKKGPVDRIEDLAYLTMNRGRLTTKALDAFQKLRAGGRLRHVHPSKPAKSVTKKVGVVLDGVAREVGRPPEVLHALVGQVLYQFANLDVDEALGWKSQSQFSWQAIATQTDRVAAIALSKKAKAAAGTSAKTSKTGGCPVRRKLAAVEGLFGSESDPGQAAAEVWALIEQRATATGNPVAPFIEKHIDPCRDLMLQVAPLQVVGSDGWAHDRSDALVDDGVIASTRGGITARGLREGHREIAERLALQHSGGLTRGLVAEEVVEHVAVHLAEVADDSGIEPDDDRFWGIDPSVGALGDMDASALAFTGEVQYLADRVVDEMISLVVEELEASWGIVI